MTLPASRDETAAGGAQIASTLINTIQDMIIGGRHGSIRRIVPAVAGHSGNGVYVNGDSSWQLQASDTLNIPLFVSDGEIIEDVFFVSDPVSTDTDFVLCQLRQGTTLLGASTSTPVGGGASDVDRTEIANIGGEQTVAAIVADPLELNSMFSVIFQADAGNSGNVRIHGIDYAVRK